MNKFIVLLAVTSAVVGLVAEAHKNFRPRVGTSHPDHQDELEFEQTHPATTQTHQQGGQYQHLRNPLSLFTDEVLFDELIRRGYYGLRFGQSCFGSAGHQGQGHQGQGRKGHRGSKHGKVPSSGMPISGMPTSGSHNSDFGGVDTGKHISGSVGPSSSFEQHGSAEGHKSSMVGLGKHLEVGQHNDNFNTNEGVSKHQATKSDKTIIKDKTSNVNDVDSFRTAKGESSGSNLSTGVNSFAAKEQGGRIEGSERFAHDGGANFEASEFGADGASGESF